MPWHGGVLSPLPLPNLVTPATNKATVIALVHACVRVNGAGLFVHDPLDGMRAAAALGAASEASIDLAHAGPSRLFCNH